MLTWLRKVRDARVRRRLLREDDAREDIVDEVHHHWIVHLVPGLEAAVACGATHLRVGTAILGRRPALG